MGKENLLQCVDEKAEVNGCSTIGNDEDLGSQSRHSVGKEFGASCRVCQCTESDRRGDAALGFLGITSPKMEARKNDEDSKPEKQSVKNVKRDSGSIEFIGPNGEVFICKADIEMGSCHYEDALVELGCSCKSDLALVHYACALKWFVNHGSTVCEICGCVAENIRTNDFRKVVSSLKEYEALRERTANGEPNPMHTNTGTDIDPDAVAAIRRQRLCEISLWFSPHNYSSNNNSTAASQVALEHPNIISENVINAENPATRWAVEGTGILLATGLLTVTLACLIAPRLGKKTAKSGLHILLGGVCALAVVVFFRFFVLTRIKYSLARYWAILFIFLFLVLFGIWASRTHGARTT
ncbi:uncharacterized protein LOC111781546 [Cucurbita pepo subsp. pepo]|uniref:uncharacterized protein LOC111781546 n=1 Tax=Cucurbita pepo subsp. pepo TaxID=3664 RepID=UPI000C9D7685|nr:uncharacterized protein LOC111781546 [Cucurbita pepo subsp. pepo]XP_023517974.1 uncharacterized protein LOC111781546 [Cucurbita pepo subsp. pepo]